MGQTATDKPKRVRTKKAAAEPAEVIQGFKGFDKNLSCLGYQYEIGGRYKHDGAVTLCRSGFHCVDGNPLGVLDFYPLVADDGGMNRFCSVEASGTIKRDGTAKIVSGEIHVKAELKLPEFIKAAIAHLLKTAKGDNVHAASGDSSQLAASGDSSQLAASGDCSQLAASGYSSQLAASGDCSQLAASGDSSQLAASGYYSRLEINGAKSAAAAVGQGSSIKAAAGTPVAICEYNRDENPIGFATGIAGQDGIPADTWLIAKGGKLVAA